MIKLIENSDRKYEFDFVLGYNKIFPNYNTTKFEGKQIFYYYTDLDTIRELKENGRIKSNNEYNVRYDYTIKCDDKYDEKYCGTRSVIAFTLNEESKYHLENVGGGTYLLHADIPLKDIVFIDTYVYIDNNSHGHKLSEYTGLVKKFGIEHVRDTTKQLNQLIDIDRVIDKVLEVI